MSSYYKSCPDIDEPMYQCDICYNPDTNIGNYFDALKLVKHNGLLIDTLSDKLKNNKNIVLEALKDTGYAFEYLPQKYKHDKNIIKLAIKEFHSVIVYVPEIILDDYKFINKMIRYNPYIFEFLPAKYKDNYKIAYYLINNLNYNFTYFSMRLKDNYNLVLLAVRKNGDNLNVVSNRLKNDYFIVLNAVKNSGRSIEYASERLKYHPKISIIAFEKYPNAFKYLPESLKSQKSIILETIERNWICRDLNEFGIFKEDNDVVELYIKKNPGYYRYFPQKYKENYNIAMTSLLENPHTFIHMPENFRNDPLFVHFAFNGRSYRFPISSIGSTLHNLIFEKKNYVKQKYPNVEGYIILENMHYKNIVNFIVEEQRIQKIGNKMLNNTFADIVFNN